MPIERYAKRTLRSLTAEHCALRAKLPPWSAALPAVVFFDAPLRNPETLFFRYVEFCSCLHQWQFPTQPVYSA